MKRKALWAASSYILLSAGGTAFSVWGVSRIVADWLLVFVVFGAPHATTGMWILLAFPCFLPVLLLLAQLACLPWILRVSRKMPTSKTSRLAATIACGFVIAALSLGLAESLFFLLPGSDRAEAIFDADAAFYATLLLGMAGIYAWSWKRARRRRTSESASFIREQFQVLLRGSTIALLAALLLYAAVPDFELALYLLAIPAVVGLSMGAFPNVMSRLVLASKDRTTGNSLT